MRNIWNSGVWWQRLVKPALGGRRSAMHWESRSKLLNKGLSQSSDSGGPLS
jgi:hypothetical protein